MSAGAWRQESGIRPRKRSASGEPETYSAPPIWPARRTKCRREIDMGAQLTRAPRHGKAADNLHAETKEPAVVVRRGRSYIESTGRGAVCSTLHWSYQDEAVL